VSPRRCVNVLSSLQRGGEGQSFLVLAGAGVCMCMCMCSAVVFAFACMCAWKQSSCPCVVYWGVCCCVCVLVSRGGRTARPARPRRGAWQRAWGRGTPGATATPPGPRTPPSAARASSGGAGAQSPSFHAAALTIAACRVCLRTCLPCRSQPAAATPPSDRCPRVGGRADGCVCATV
jgi:hypothetical protein